MGKHVVDLLNEMYLDIYLDCFRYFWNFVGWS